MVDQSGAQASFQYVYAFSIALMVLQLAFLGVGQAVTRFISKKKRMSFVSMQLSAFLNGASPSIGFFFVAVNAEDGEGDMFMWGSEDGWEGVSSRFGRCGENSEWL